MSSEDDHSQTAAAAWVPSTSLTTFDGHLSGDGMASTDLSWCLVRFPTCSRVKVGFVRQRSKDVSRSRSWASYFS